MIEFSGTLLDADLLYPPKTCVKLFDLMVALIRPGRGVWTTEEWELSDPTMFNAAGWLTYIQGQRPRSLELPANSTTTFLGDGTRIALSKDPSSAPQESVQAIQDTLADIFKF